MDPFNGGEISPGPQVQTDEEILDWVRKDGETALHPSCSAKMGPASDPMAVVDPLTMKVHGMENLRVVDASAMPRTTNGNIHAPVLMLAEKAADIIRGRNRLNLNMLIITNMVLTMKKLVQWKTIHSTNIKMANEKLN